MNQTTSVVKTLVGVVIVRVDLNCKPVVICHRVTQVRGTVSDEACRVAGDYFVISNILCDHGSGINNGPFA